MVFGTFDILHPGHLYFFTQAKKYGQKLIVVVGRDLTSANIKKRTPRYNERDRLLMVKSLKIVDRAVLGHPKDRRQPIKKWRPNVVCLGYDQDISPATLKNWLKTIKSNARVVKLKAFKPASYKSSKLAVRLSAANR